MIPRTATAGNKLRLDLAIEVVSSWTSRYFPADAPKSEIRLLLELLSEVQEILDNAACEHEKIDLLAHDRLIDTLRIPSPPLDSIAVANARLSFARIAIENAEMHALHWFKLKEQIRNYARALPHRQILS